MTKCEYMRKLCKSGCDNYVCRAFFPLKQPLIAPDRREYCQSAEHLDCEIKKDGLEWREEKRLKELDEHCPFAANTMCGKPWLWMCKGSSMPFVLTTYEHDPEKPMVPKRDADGNILFNYDVEVFQSTCLSGDKTLYPQCPHYQLGMKVKEVDKRIKEEERIKNKET